MVLLSRMLIQISTIFRIGTLLTKIQVKVGYLNRIINGGASVMLQAHAFTTIQVNGPHLGGIPAPKA